MTYDTLIAGGTIIDGSGARGYDGNVAIVDGRIAEVGTTSGSARNVINAAGKVVAPGFIDIHTHYDAQVFWDGSVSPSSRHGVTTIVGGNCGFSIAPLNGQLADAEYLKRMLARVEGMPLESLSIGVPWDWRSFDDYLSRLKGSVAVNAGFMVGHSALRRAVMGERAVGKAATEPEIAAMEDLLRQSIREGGLGFSTTISPGHNDADGNPVPSRHAAREEFIRLASVIREFEGTCLEVLPNASVAFDRNAMDFLADMSLAANRPLNWNVMVPDSMFPEVYQSQLIASDYAAAKGARVHPLVAAQVIRVILNFVSGFVLDSLPGWDALMRLPLAWRRTILADPTERKKLDERARSPAAGPRAMFADWPRYRFVEIFSPENKKFEGMLVSEVAAQLNKNPFDALIDIVLADDLRTLLEMAPKAADEESWRIRGELWRDERTILGASDAGAHLDMIDSFAASTQVLGVGVRERNLLTLEEAVRQLTGVPAALYGIRQRGTIKPGNWADLVVFDPETVGCGPVYTRFDLPGGAGRLYADAIGIQNVLVNGCEIVRGQTFLGTYPGRVLHSGADTATVALGGTASD